MNYPYPNEFFKDAGEEAKSHIKDALKYKKMKPDTKVKFNVSGPNGEKLSTTTTAKAVVQALTAYAMMLPMMYPDDF